jgi:hypothetical protein
MPASTTYEVVIAKRRIGIDCIYLRSAGPSKPYSLLVELRSRHMSFVPQDFGHDSDTEHEKEKRVSWCKPANHCIGGSSTWARTRNLRISRSVNTDCVDGERRDGCLGIPKNYDFASCVSAGFTLAVSFRPSRYSAHDCIIFRRSTRCSARL